MHFVHTVSIMRAWRLRHIVMKRFEFMEKFYSSKTLVKMAGGAGMHTQRTPHLPWIRPWLYNNEKWPQILTEIPKAVRPRLL